MNLTQLKSLIAVAEAGSFTAAAESVGVTQSGMSQAITALEESLGIKLLVRERHGVTLTAFGEQALGHARSAFAHLESIRHKAAQIAGDQTGSIRLAAFPSVFATVLPPLLRRFRLLYPDIEVIPLETDDREVELWLESGIIDLGVVLNPTSERDTVLIGEDAWVAVVPIWHDLAQYKQLSLLELTNEPFVLATGGCHVHAASIMADAGLSLSDVRIEVRDWVSAVALVRAGEGISIVPESSLPENRKGLRVLPLNPPVSRQFGLMVSKHSTSRPATLMMELTKRS